jgi:hypothetical protein
LNDASFDFLLGEGWSGAEDWGRWTVGHRATMRVSLKEGYNYDLILGVFPFCPDPFDGQTLKVGWNDKSLAESVFNTCEHRELLIEIAGENVTGELDTLWLEFGKAISPAQMGLSGDVRRLAVGFTLVNFIQKTE